MFTKHKALLGLAALCVMLPHNSFANHTSKQEHTNDQTSAQIVVHPLRSSLTAPNMLQKEQEVKTIAGSVAVIPVEKIENTFAKSFQDTLGKTPGVFAQNRYGEEVRLSIRGSGLSRAFHLRGIELMVDDVPVNLADGSGDFQEIDPTNMRHMEVYKGANALRYGVSTLGGAVNVVTPTARTVNYSTAFRVDGGSFGNIRTHAATAMAKKQWDAYAAMTLAHADGYRAQSREDKARLSTNVGYQISDKAETRFYVTYNHLNQEVPGSLTYNDAIKKPRTTAAVNRFNDYARDVRSLRISNKTVVQLTADTRLDTGVFVNNKDLYHPIFQVLDQQAFDYGAFSRVYSGFDAFGLTHKTMFGVNYHGGQNDAQQFINVGGKRGARTGDVMQKSQNVALYGEGLLRATRDFGFVFGGQFMWASREADNKINAAMSDEKTYTAFNPKVGVLWDVSPVSQVFANVSRSSEVPTLSELVQMPVTGFVPLDLQTAWTAEIGTRGSHGNFAWDMTAYHARIKNEMLQYTTDVTIPAATFNADNTIHQGLELSGTWTFLRDVWRHNDAWSVTQNYTFNDFRFDNDVQYNDNDIVGVPRHVLQTELRYAQDTWSVAPRVDFVPEAPYVDFTNTTKASSYFLLHLEAHKKVNEAVDLFAEGRNLTDKRYVSNFSTVTNASAGPAPAIFYPGEGRSFFAGVRARF